jgi:hypothetical protein
LVTAIVARNVGDSNSRTNNTDIGLVKLSLVLAERLGLRC